MGHNTTHNTQFHNRNITPITLSPKPIHSNGCSVMVKHYRPHNITVCLLDTVVMVAMNGGKDGR